MCNQILFLDRKRTEFSFLTWTIFKDRSVVYFGFVIVLFQHCPLCLFVLVASPKCRPFWLRATIPHVAQSPADDRAHCVESCTGLLSRLGESLLSLLVSTEREREREEVGWTLARCRPLPWRSIRRLHCSSAGSSETECQWEGVCAAEKPKVALKHRAQTSLPPPPSSPWLPPTPACGIV